MNLIPCDEECIYQCEGYCCLETPAVITNMIESGCAYMIPHGHGTNKISDDSRKTNFKTP